MSRLEGGRVVGVLVSIFTAVIGLTLLLSNIALLTQLGPPASRSVVASVDSEPGKEPGKSAPRLVSQPRQRSALPTAPSFLSASAAATRAWSDSAPVTALARDETDTSERADSPTSVGLTAGSHTSERANDASPLTASAPAQEYTWQDGDRTRTVVLQSDLILQPSANNGAEAVVADYGARSIVQRQADSEQGAGQPVFRARSGGQLMTLPGGILLALDPDWDQTRISLFFFENGIDSNRAEPLQSLPNAYFVETEPGFPSLSLANNLATQEGVIVSSPNWEVAIKFQ